MWLVGARGAVAVTSVTGLLAVRAGLTGTAGCVTELPQFSGRGLPDLADLVVGGYDVVGTPLLKRAEQLSAAGVLPGPLLAAVAGELAEVDKRVLMLPVRATAAETVEAVIGDLTAFRDRHDLDALVVVNVASTEPRPADHPAHADVTMLRGHLEVLPPSALMACAAFEAGCAFVDFTPSAGVRLPALDELARLRGVPYAGSDGKTGETLIRSVLAPMFASRNLTVRSWSGVNLLGGGDGATLTDPGANAAKTASKERVLSEVLGYRPQGSTRIDYVEELGDFKTAWDLISFAGFLGTRMRLEFTWHGCDSALAAPLVLDLTRLTAAAQRANRSGALAELAFFFKDPAGAAPAGLAEQWSALVSFVSALDAA
ncbi:myo-inositol-1-phosphate synthase [Mangrovihabitans endophyticus]|uniref:Myo-inositol-1-phosphate synthase n=2 Tax=Mangrovihabitans endophyticus TaxID=1751298 RepID=A0A8J3BVJ8_9ACTN|nr:myo-inositol-1-phosphate synthase [Mangrovihabitans endophyticus]